MNCRSILLGFVLFDFLVLTGYASAQVGYGGVVASQFESWGGIQVLVDLVIAGGLAAVCMIIEARKRGVNPWGYLVLTLFLRLIGPLSYLLVREWDLQLGQY